MAKDILGRANSFRSVKPNVWILIDNEIIESYIIRKALYLSFFHWYCSSIYLWICHTFTLLRQSSEIDSWWPKVNNLTVIKTSLNRCCKLLGVFTGGNLTVMKTSSNQFYKLLCHQTYQISLMFSICFLL